MTRRKKTLGQQERNAAVTQRLYMEKLRFLDGTYLRNVDVSLVDGHTARMVRRIVEKRACQHYFRQNRKSFRSSGNRSRHLMDRATSYELYMLGVVEGNLKREPASHWKRKFDPLLDRVVLRKKVGYDTLEDAHRIAVRWNFIHVFDFDPVTPYYCPACKKFHVGHTHMEQAMAN